MKGETDSVHPKDFVQGWELCGRAAIRVADWKALFIPAPKGPHRWQLYNLEKDPGEIYDLSDEYPHKLTELLKHWDQYVEECGVIPLHPELGAYLEATEEQMEVGLSQAYCHCFEFIAYFAPRKTLGSNMNTGNPEDW